MRPLPTDTVAASSVQAVTLTGAETTWVPSTFTTICGAPLHWSLFARSVSLVADGVVACHEAVALDQISNAWPALAVVSANTRPEPAVSVIDSASNPLAAVGAETKVLGSGKRLFGAADDMTALKLAEVRTLGPVALLTYTAAPSQA